jgi:hypothetical protein
MTFDKVFFFSLLYDSSAYTSEPPAVNSDVSRQNEFGDNHRDWVRKNWVDDTLYNGNRQ